MSISYPGQSLKCVKVTTLGPRTLVLSVLIQICKIFLISIEHKCPVNSVFEYFLCFFVSLVYVPVNSVGHEGWSVLNFT